MYLVVEWVTMSAPNSMGRQFMGVGKVLSTISGTPCSWAAWAKTSRSATAREGLERVSANTARVLGRMAARSSSKEASGATKVVSMPISFMVL